MNPTEFKMQPIIHLEGKAGLLPRQYPAYAHYYYSRIFYFSKNISFNTYSICLSLYILFLLEQYTHTIYNLLKNNSSKTNQMIY
jgi:hypothetical protein